MTGAPAYAVGWQTPVYVPDPAAGSSWSYRVDGRYVERLVAATCTLTTDAVAGGRYPKLVLSDNEGRPLVVSPVYNGMGVSSQVVVSAWVGAGALAQITANGAFTALPDVLVPGDWTWALQVDGLDAGDTVTGVTLLVQRFPNDAAVISAGR